MDAAIAALANEVNKQFDSVTGKFSQDMCDHIKDLFTKDNPQSDSIKAGWAWHKNKVTPKGSRIMYFIQPVTFNGETYHAVAHLHGSKSSSGSWKYDDADWKYVYNHDKLDIMKE